MRSMFKFAMVGAALVASSAYADVLLPSSGNGELTLFVKNNTTGAVYARGLQLTVDSVLTQSAISSGAYTGPVQSTGYSLPSPIGPDATLTSFLGAGTDFSWTVMAGDNTSPALSQAGATGGRRYVVTTQLDLSNNTGSIPSNSNLNSIYGNMQGMMVDLNGALPNSSGSSTTSGLWGTPGTPYDADQDEFGAGLPDANALNSAAHLYLFAGQQGTNATAARVYEGLKLTLTSNGTLVSTPLPPALWLLGSALVGITGVARRRRAAETQGTELSAVPA